MKNLIVAVVAVVAMAIGTKTEGQLYKIASLKSEDQVLVPRNPDGSGGTRILYSKQESMIPKSDVIIESLTGFGIDFEEDIYDWIDVTWTDKTFRGLSVSESVINNGLTYTSSVIHHITIPENKRFKPSTVVEPVLGLDSVGLPLSVGVRVRTRDFQTNISYVPLRNGGIKEIRRAELVSISVVGSSVSLELNNTGNTLPAYFVFLGLLEVARTLGFPMK